MSKIDEYIKRYGLKVVEIKKINLSLTYCQYRPEINVEEIRMVNSPHREFADLYYKHGINWLEDNFHKTKYSNFQKNISGEKQYIPKKKIRLFKSIKKGYLINGYKDSHIVILNKPLIHSRYGVEDTSLETPEIFMGHHRAGALLALGKNKVDVIIAQDIQPGSCQCYGKLHNVYIKIRNKYGEHKG